MSLTFHNPRFRATTGTGVAYSGARLFAYITATSTPQDTFSNSTLVTPNANPVVADGNGLFGDIYLDMSLPKYKFVCKTSVADGDLTLWTVDPYEAKLSQAELGLILYPRTTAEIAALMTPTNYAYKPGHIFRWTTTDSYSSDDTTAIANWLLVPGYHYAPPGTAITSAQQAIASNDFDLYAYGFTLKAKDATNFEHVLYSTGRTNVVVSGLTADANQANRVSQLTTRGNGIYFVAMTDSHLVDCRVKNGIGAAAVPGVGITMASGSLRCSVIEPNVQDCGIVGKASDGIFLSGTQVTCTNPTVLNCNDTGVVVESSDQSGVTGGTVKGCAVVCAITNATNTAVSGNYIDGLTGYGWNASVTGGVQIGNPSAATTGDLLNTRLNVILDGTGSTGPAINVRQTGTAVTKGLSINARVRSAPIQALLIAGQDVEVQGDYEGASNNALIQVSTESARVQFKTPTLRGQFTFGIYSDSADDIDVITPIIDGDGANSTHGIYFAGTATGCKVKLPNITGMTVAKIGADSGTIPDAYMQEEVAVLAYSASMTPNFLLGDCQTINATNGTAFTINAPSNPISGRLMTVRIANTSGGALGAVTWNAVYKMSAWTSPATGTNRSILFRYNGTNWIQESVGVDVAN